jgi:hypothetical protein
VLGHIVLPLTLIGFSCRLPVLRTDNWQTHLTLLIDIRMIDFCFETNLRRFERIFGRKYNFDPECAFVVRCIFLTHFQEDTKNKENDMKKKNTLALTLPAGGRSAL